MTEADIGVVSLIDPTADTSRDQLAAELQRPWSRRWVARDEDGVVVAFALAWHVADELHVLNVATRADHRRHGIGRALMAELLSYSRSHGVRRLLLEVRSSNRPAISLYRSTGFYATRLRPRYYRDDEDAVEMALALDPTTGAVIANADEARLES